MSLGVSFILFCFPVSYNSGYHYSRLCYHWNGAESFHHYSLFIDMCQELEGAKDCEGREEVKYVKYSWANVIAWGMNKCVLH